MYFFFSVPQFILDSHAQQNQYVNIIVTQPRRLAAQSVAKRVCRERGLSDIMNENIFFKKVNTILLSQVGH